MDKKINYDKKIKLELTLKELFEMSSAIHDAGFAEVDFTKIKDRRVRKIFADSYVKRHDLWLKIINLAEKNIEHVK